MAKTDVYAVGALSDARRGRLRYGVRHFLWSYAIKDRHWRAAGNYFNGWLAEHEGCHHNAGRGWTRRAARRRVERIHRATRPSQDAAGDAGEGKHLPVMGQPGILHGRCCETCGRAGDNFDVHIRPSGDAGSGT